jgi:excisionase family DNA binding protein
MTETSPMLTPQAIAEILGVHQKTVHLWLRNGKLKGIKISYRAWRIPQSALDQFIEQNSNVVSQHGMVAQQGTAKNDPPSTKVTPEPFSVDLETPQVKMKHYIQDIMGEQAPGKKTE